MRISNRGIARVQAVVIIIIVLAMVAVGAFMARMPGQTPSSTSTAKQTGLVSAPNPDTLMAETVSQPNTLDPAICSDTRSGSVLQNVYETLVFQGKGEKNEVVPWLAQSYDISPDGLTYTFHLRSGITFTDGTPFDANAVYFSLMRALMIDDPNSLAFMFATANLRGYLNYSKQYNNAGPSAPTGYGPKYTKAQLDDLLNAKPVEVIDPLTVVLHLEKPYTPLLLILSTTAGGIVSPTAFKSHWKAPTDGTPYIEGATAGDYQSHLNLWPSENVVGTAPYTVKSWDKASQTIILSRNEKYWGGPDKRGLAPISNVIMKGIDDPTVKILNFKSGTSDILGLPTSMTSQLPGSTLFQFADRDTWMSQHKLVSTSPDYQLFPLQGLRNLYSIRAVGFNQKIYGADLKLQSFQPFADVRIRKAFVLAFNRTAYIHDVLLDVATPASQMIPPGVFGYDPTIQPTPYDLKTAKQLLLDAGAHPMKPENAFGPQNQKTVQFAYAIGQTNDEATLTILATAINSMARDTGLYAEIVGVAAPQLQPMRHSGRSQVSGASWFVDYVDADDFVVPYAYSNSFIGGVIGYNNPEVDKLVNKEANTIDTTARQAMIGQINKMLNDDWAYLWVNYGVTFSLVRSWVHERAGATVASGIEHFNPAIYGFYFYEIQKGARGTSQSLAQSFIAELQLSITGLRVREEPHGPAPCL